MGLPLVWRTIRGAIEGRFATDIVASLSIGGAIALGQPLVALVIVVMQTGGEALEQYAEGRASAAVRELEAAAPRRANLIRNGEVEEVPATSVTIGDVLLIRPGDLVPCDGVITSGESELDTSSLTGEALPVRAIAGTAVMSGMANALGSFRCASPRRRSRANTRASSKRCAPRNRARRRCNVSPTATPFGLRRSPSPCAPSRGSSRGTGCAFSRSSLSRRRVR